ncbi:hypothetical protein [Rhodovulum kholense]|uniref:Uncharacterized protein n=1 Tax=Rhodovulum kholense TaxID=453584 RepID=A0A8E3ASX6_9RHOB|nr:hypothetical protein [Rhodovulum kholense]PTW52190.1 hypothetical protein C8N38_101495 [Rhodovulum kholense]
MTRQDRTTLKSFFRDGALPTAEHYRDLIESCVNQTEDGFSKTPADGLQLHSVGSSRAVLSLYEGLGTPYASWVLEHGETQGHLHFRQGLGVAGNTLDSAAGGWVTGPPGLTLGRDGRIGISEAAPEWRLDLRGTARMDGRLGRATEGLADPVADGTWHDITRPMTGCQAFEVMAGVGGEVGQGHYALIHAVAMNAFHPRNAILNWMFGRRRIRAQTAVYGSYADRLRLRWLATEERHHFKLQIRTNADYGQAEGAPVRIRYHLTRLWFDPLMTGSRGPAGGPDREDGLL